MTPLPSASRRGFLLLFVFLAQSFALEAEAQHFGRNKIQYENFDWQILSTPHFEMFFYEGEEDLAARAAVIAEDAYRRLSDVFDHELSSQIPFVLYASPNDFQQTNITGGFIGEGTGGFSEPVRNRVVLPYPGSNAGFVHVINHELVHVFMFDLVYHSTQRGSSRRALFPVPLWFAEGAAEWFSAGWDAQSDMWMRDATIYDWVVPLPSIYGGFQVYKEGQSAMRFLAQSHGDEAVVEFFKQVGATGNVSRALQAAIGMDEKAFSEKWIKSLKQEYWPLYADKKEAEEFARRLTHHAEEGNYFFQQPSLSPDGRYLAYFSDVGGFVDLLLMDAESGEVIRKLVTGYRSNRFLTLHSFDSSIGFSPQSDRICFVAKSGRYETLYVVRIEDGEILQDIPLHMDIARSPAWSPTGERVVLSGTRGGQTDLYLIDLANESIQPVTQDFDDEHAPAWFPDGERILFSGYPNSTVDVELSRGEAGLELSPVDFAAADNMRDVQASLDLFTLDLQTGERQVLVATEGADDDPVAVSDTTIVFVSDLTGVSNLYRYDLGTGELRRLTDVLGGTFHPSVSTQADRLAFSAFNEAGWDMYLAEDFAEWSKDKDFSQESERSLIVMRAREDQDDLQEMVEALPSLQGDPPVRSVLPDGAVLAGVAMTERALSQGEKGVQLEPASVRPAYLAVDSTAVEIAQVDAPAFEPRHPVGTVESYKLRFSLDPMGSAGAGVSYSEGLGLGVANMLSFSDLLGNHRMQFLINFYGNIKNSDLAASYYYLKRRVNFAGGAFHYRNYVNSTYARLGEVFDRSRLFTERSYGVFGLASLPLTQFDRFDFELQLYTSEKTFFERNSDGTFNRTGAQSDRLLQPSLSYIHDSSFYGRHGPVTGTRWLASFSPAIPVGADDMDRTAIFVDYRRYMRLWDRNSFAVRMVGALSNGSFPRTFVLGGASTLRGWDVYDYERVDAGGDFLYDDLLGSRMLLMNVEYRFPLVDALILGWPGRLGIGGVGGVAFFDVGTAFDDRFRPFGTTPQGHLQLNDLNANIGFGIRANLGFLPLKFDWAWKTDFVTTGGDVQYTFSIGPDF